MRVRGTPSRRSHAAASRRSGTWSDLGRSLPVRPGETLADAHRGFQVDVCHGRLLDRQELATSSSHLVACLGLDMAAANAFITYLTAVESASRYIGTSGALEATDADRGPTTSAEAMWDDDDARDGRSSGSANPRRFLPLTTPTRDRCRTHPSVRSPSEGVETGVSAARLRRVLRALTGHRPRPSLHRFATSENAAAA